MKEVKAEDLPFLEAVSWHAYSSNNDGEGYFTPAIMEKSVNKMRLSSDPRLIGAPWIVLHERKATAGRVNLDNTHPIVMKNCLVAHNGVLWGAGNKRHSDSYELARMLSAMAGAKPFIEAFEEAIRHFDGSKSIIAWDKGDGLYYFKDDATSFYISSGRNEWFASTDYDNALYASTWYGWKKPLVVKPNTIFRLLPVPQALVKVERPPIEQPEHVAEYMSLYGIDSWEVDGRNVVMMVPSGYEDMAFMDAAVKVSSIGALKKVWVPLSWFTAKYKKGLYYMPSYEGPYLENKLSRVHASSTAAFRSRKSRAMG